jgi:ParB/RepB/Spo0J family partition protein
MRVEDILISKIKVGPRQRKELGKVEDLAGSMKELGLLNPLVVVSLPDGFVELVAGERRLTAAKALGWEKIRCTIYPRDDVELELIELEENAKREDLTWQENIQAIRQVVLIYKRKDWNLQQIAAKLNMSATYISKVNNLALATENKHKDLLECSTLTAAHNMLQRRMDRAAEEEISKFSKITPEAGVQAFLDGKETPQELATQEAQSSLFSPPKIELDFASILPEELPCRIICQDFTEWAASPQKVKYNFIHCDFPYGINHHNSAQGNTKGHENYRDSEDVYWALIQTLFENRANYFAAAGHIMFWFSMKFYTETLAKFRELAPEISWIPFPLVWHKSDNVGILPDANHEPRRVYETALLGTWGNRSIVRAVSNTISLPTKKKQALHKSEKPQDVLLHFLRMLVDDTSSVLDPTCGSGNAICAAKKLRCKEALGIELNSSLAQQAQNRLDLCEAEEEEE